VTKLVLVTDVTGVTVASKFESVTVV